MQRGTSLLWAIAVLTSCGPPGTDSKVAAPLDVPEAPASVSHCYLQITQCPPVIVGTDTFKGKLDSLYIRLDILGELANGSYHGLHSNNERKAGSFTGTLENGVVTALYTSTTEGVPIKEEILFKVEPSGLRVATGEMVQSEGIRLFKNKGMAQFGTLVPEVPCK